MLLVQMTNEKPLRKNIKKPARFKINYFSIRFKINYFSITDHLRNG